MQSIKNINLPLKSILSKSCIYSTLNKSNIRLHVLLLQQNINKIYEETNSESLKLDLIDTQINLSNLQKELQIETYIKIPHIECIRNYNEINLPRKIDQH